MGRGVRALAQIHDEERTRVVVPYRAKPEQKSALVDVHAEELKSRKPEEKRLSLSRTVEYVVGLGLDLYWARHELGAQIDAVAGEHGWDRRRALTELIRRGLSKGKK